MDFVTDLVTFSFDLVTFSMDFVTNLVTFSFDLECNAIVSP